VKSSDNDELRIRTFSHVPAAYRIHRPWPWPLIVPDFGLKHDIKIGNFLNYSAIRRSQFKLKHFGHRVPYQLHQFSSKLSRISMQNPHTMSAVADDCVRPERRMFLLCVTFHDAARYKCISSGRRSVDYRPCPNEMQRMFCSWTYIN
jgi:hypothetical protein